MSEYGVHSEVGQLRKVIVHRPGLEMRRLTPSNCQELLFDDVIWARKARQDHDAFVDLMRAEFGITVWRVHELLDTLPPREALVLRLRYGLPAGEIHTLKEIGEKLGITRERVRQIEAQALRRLRHPSLRKELVDYVKSE